MTALRKFMINSIDFLWPFIGDGSYLINKINCRTIGDGVMKSYEPGRMGRNCSIRLILPTFCLAFFYLFKCCEPIDHPPDEHLPKIL